MTFADNETTVDAAGTTTWWLYLIECSNGSYYAGITTDVQRRYAQHLSGKGAKYTRSFPPRRLLGARACPDRASASRAEYAIRKLSRSDKLGFVAEDSVNRAVGGRGST